MDVTVEKLSPVLIEFQVKIPADRVKESIDRAFQDLARSATVKGFRKGKVPRNVLAHLFGDRVGFEVANKLVEDTLSKALQQQKIQPISSPTVEKPKASPGEDFAYRARFEVTPTIDELRYEGLEVKRTVYAVTDAMVDAELQRLREQHATLRAPDPPRPAARGDVATIDFALDLDGKPYPEASSTDFTAEIGSSALLSAISDALVGKEPGAVCEAEATFSDTHQHEALRGKKGTFHVTLKDVKEKLLPELDDELAKDLGQYDTLEAAREGIRQRLDKAVKEQSDNELAEALVAELCRLNPVPAPPSLVQQQAKLQEEEFLQQARKRGQNLRAAPAEIRDRIEADAAMKVRAGLVMAEIAKRSGLKVTDDDVEKAYRELAEQSGKNVARIKAQYQDKTQREMLLGMILEDKVLDIVQGAAKIEDVPAGAEPPKP
jgi:trigger factor